MPKSNVRKFVNAIGEKLGITIAPSTHQYLVAIGNEFIEALTSESVTFASEDKVNSLRHDHLVRSLEHLGFASYVPRLNAEHERLKALAPIHRAKLSAKREKMRQMNTPEMIQLQQQLFAAAKSQSLVELTDRSKEL